MHLDALDSEDIQKLQRLPTAPRVLEINFEPLIKATFPEYTELIDTRLRWEEARTYKPRNAGLARRFTRLTRNFLRALRLCSRQRYDIVVTRCMGPANSFGQPWTAHLARLLLGALLRRLVLFAARGERVKLAVIDLTDHLTIHPRDHDLIRHCDLYFKRELADNHWHSLESILPRGASAGDVRRSPAGVALRSKLRPFALGIESSKILEPIPSARKEFDLFYVGTPSGIPVREGLATTLKALSGRGWKVFAPEERISPEKFLFAARQSRLCLSPGGVGWDCYRHYEVVACGSVPVLNFRPLHSIAPFRDGIECFYFDPQDDLVAKVEEWLRMPASTLDRMVAAAQGRLRRHYTLEALGTYVLDETRKLS